MSEPSRIKPHPLAVLETEWHSQFIAKTDKEIVWVRELRADATDDGDDGTVKFCDERIKELEQMKATARAPVPGRWYVPREPSNN